MNLQDAYETLRAAAEHIPDSDAAPYDEALYTVRQATFDLRSPDPRDADANKVVRITHFVEVPREAKMDETLSAFAAGIGSGGPEGTDRGVTARFRELRINDPVPEFIVTFRVPK